MTCFGVQGLSVSSLSHTHNTTIVFVYYINLNLLASENSLK